MESWRTGVAALLIALVFPVFADADKDLEHLQKIKQRDEVDIAISKGLYYLTRRQDRKTGAFHSSTMPNTVTGLSCLALMSTGHFPGRGRFGSNLQLAINYLLQKSRAHKGYFGHEANGRMYAHAICTMALAEAYGMMPSEEENRAIHAALQRAVDIIIKAQVKAKGQYHGGWHYHTAATTADFSVTSWQIQALQAARICHIRIPESTFNDAIKFVRRMYNPRQKAFTYDGERTTPSTRAAGVISMHLLGANRNPQDMQWIKDSASFLLSVNPSHGQHFYSQSYYIATSSCRLGGQYRDVAIPKLENALARLQKRDGSFPKHTGEAGGSYATAFAIICLGVRYRFLPIHQ